VEAVAAALWLVHLELPEVAPVVGPGQFALVQCADPGFPVFDPYLPRAYFVFALDRTAGRLSLLVREGGRGSAWLARRRAGQRVLVHGPIGRAIAPARLTRHLLLLAQGTTAAAGLALLAGEAARRRLSVTLVENVPLGETGVPPHLLRADVEYRATSPDSGGLLATLPPLLPWADELIVAAPPPMLDTLSALRRARLAPFTLHGSLPIQAIPLPDPATDGRSGGEYVPCGTGACGACVVETRRGPRLFCRDGPAFPLEALRFDAQEGEDEGDTSADSGLVL
jgi:dihydroorotate dehydrogenase electron transfer subunit